jgi:sugar lactone lactonase YvrE
MAIYCAGKSRAAIAVPILLLTACGGGGGGGKPATYTVGGTITGLVASGLELANGTMTVTVASGATTFEFAQAVPDGTQYAVTVMSQPAGEACHVMFGIGSVSSSAVTGIKVSCGVPALEALAGDFGGPGNADGIGAAARFDLHAIIAIPDPLFGDVTDFYTPGAVATDSLGNVYVADAGNNTIRKITAQGAVSTLAGTAGLAGSDDGAGTAARFSGPTSVATDGAGNIFVADTGNNAIRIVTPAGTVGTFAGAAAGFNLAYYYYIPTVGEYVQGYGTVATDLAGNVYVGDCGNFIVRKITPAGVVTTFAGQAGVPGYVDTLPGQPDSALFGCPAGLATDSGGDVYVADTPVTDFPNIVGASALRKISPAGVVTTADGGSGGGVATDSLGNIYIANSGGSIIVKVSTTGAVTTLAGVAGTTGSADGPAAAATFNEPASVALDPAGNVFVADTGNNAIRKITPAGVVSTFAGAASKSGSAEGTGTAARFSAPVGLAAGAGGNVYVADSANDAVRQITAGGTVSSFKAMAGLQPWNLAADSTGNLYVVATGTGGSTIQKITPAGVMTTFAGAAANFQFVGLAPLYAGQSVTYGGAVATDAAGNVYVADTFNETIRKITPDGTVTTLAGTTGVGGHADGTGAAAQFLYPQGIATDNDNNVFVADTGNNTIRKITAAGVVTTLAGTAGNAGSADGSGPAASFNRPTSLAADDSGNLLAADTGNNTLRKITPQGVVTTIVGRPGISSFEPGPLPGLLSQPLGIAISGTSLYVTSENGVAVVDYFP